MRAHTHIPIPFVVPELGRINLSGVGLDKIIFYNEFSSLSSSMYLTRRLCATDTERDKLFLVVIFPHYHCSQRDTVISDYEYGFVSCGYVYLLNAVKCCYG